MSVESLGELRVGDPTIDAEHMALFQSLSSLQAKALPFGLTEDFNDELSQLSQRLIRHFLNEEAIFTSLGMPEDEAKAHLHAHQSIIENTVDLSLRLMRGDRIGSEEVVKIVHDWVIEHVVQHDLNIRRYLGIVDGVLACREGSVVGRKAI